MAREALNLIAEAEANGKAQKRSAQEEAAKILGQIKADSEKLSAFLSVYQRSRSSQKATALAAATFSEST